MKMFNFAVDDPFVWLNNQVYVFPDWDIFTFEFLSAVEQTYHSVSSNQHEYQVRELYVSAS
jgi:hypothetical protein